MARSKAEIRAYHRKYQKKKAADWRDWMRKYLGGKCIVCGTTDGLEAHHKDKTQKEHNISCLWSRKIEIQMAELAKCELRCLAHHHEIHRSAPEHSAAGYKRGCRCEECLTARREYNKKWMADWRAAGSDKSRINFKGDG